MTKIDLVHAKSKCVLATKQRPKSLRTPIPALCRDFLELEKGTVLTWELYQENDGEKYIKIKVEK